MMKVLNDTPATYRETLLFRTLSDRKDASRFVSVIESTISIATSIQSLVIAGPFRDYTLHDETHSLKLLHLAGHLIGEDTAKRLSSLEITLMTLSFYIHDLGMVLSPYERERLITEPSFITFSKRSGELYERLISARAAYEQAEAENKTVLEYRIFEINEALLSEYLRPKHADKKVYEGVIAKIKNDLNNASLFFNDSVCYEKYLIEICHSHNQPPNYLMERSGIHDELFPRELAISKQMVNLQFCAAVLRLVDILDFDSERTPHSLFSSLGLEFKNLPTATVSIKEWKKQMAVHNLAINENELVVTAHSDHPSIEKAINEFSHSIESELRNTNAVLQKNTTEIQTKYTLLIPLTVRTKIESNGYVFKDYALRLNEKRIMNLLMGENLYVNAPVAIRELLQNSIDACLLKSRLGINGYVPNIEVSFYRNGEEHFLRITDNGIGMDDHVLNEYFFKVGNSYYSSGDFEDFKVRNQLVGFDPISRFGIGLISVFMICDHLHVTTSNKGSVSNDTLTRSLNIDGVNTIAYVTEKVDDFWGTQIDLRLKAPFDDEKGAIQLVGFVKANILRPAVNITFPDRGTKRTVTSNNFISLKRGYIPVLQKLNIEFCEIDVTRFSSILTGKIFFFFPRNANGRLEAYDPTRSLVIGRSPLKETELFDNIESIGRITVNGIRMNLKKVGSLFSRGNRQANYAIDIEVVASKDITYDVSRDRVIGKGIFKIRGEIFAVVKRYLKSTGLLDQFEEESKAYFERVEYSKMPTKPLDDKTSQFIITMIEKNGWRTGIHKEIAPELGMSNYEATKYITALKFLGRLPGKPAPHQSEKTVATHE